MINLLCLLCSFCIQFCAITYPVDYTPVNEHFSAELLTVWNNIVASGYNVDPEKLILVNRSNSLTPSGSAPYAVFYPAEPFNQQQSSIVVTAQADTYIQVNATNYYRWLLKSDFSINGSPSINNIGKVGFYDISSGTYTNSSGNIMYNNYYVMPLNGNTNNPSFTWSSSGGTLPGIGSMSPTGHSSGGNPLESLQNFSWSAHSSTYNQTGHNTHVNPSLATPDYTNSTQNLLAQIVDNTNSLIENTNGIGGALETINGNIINGVSAIFNGVSQLNDNFVSSVIIDKEELNDQWTASNTYLAFISMENSFNLLQSTADDLIDRYSATEDVDELIIPIDLTVWQISSSDYGNFKPFDEVYYMRFGFLDESKALWQPLFIALLYFCLFFGIVLDLPNIIRGAK